MTRAGAWATRVVDPEAWQRGLELADGDPALLEVGDGGRTVTVHNRHVDDAEQAAGRDAARERARARASG